MSLNGSGPQDTLTPGISTSFSDSAGWRRAEGRSISTGVSSFVNQRPKTLNGIAVREQDRVLLSFTHI
jgi:hypothetical protein